jgi:hypothetical protein
MIIDFKTRQVIQPNERNEMLTAFIGICKAPMDAMMLREDSTTQIMLNDIRRLRDEARE